jgi:hypothetical protein
MEHSQQHSFPGGEMNYLSRSTTSPRNTQFKNNPPATGHWMPPISAPGSEENLDREFGISPYHRVPSSPPECIGSESRTAREGSKDETDCYKSNTRDPSQEIASVLLLAAAATSERELAIAANEELEGCRDSDTVDSNTSQGNRPLKKRRNMETISRAQSGEGRDNPDDACHVSPISHSSKSGTTVESQALNHDTPSTSSAHSFDAKDDGTSGSTSTNIKTNSACPRTQRSFYKVISHFPAALHWLLSEASVQPSSTEFIVDPTVLQWVSHGQAWKIVRWDAFQRSVLPAIFPQMTFEANTMFGSIDAFMWQLKAWGFEEIKDGPDVGAFTHTVCYQL